MVTSGFKRSARGPAGMVRRSDEGAISENIYFRVILHPCSFVSSLQANRVFRVCDVFGDRAATDLPDCQPPHLSLDRLFLREKLPGPKLQISVPTAQPPVGLCVLGAHATLRDQVAERHVLSLRTGELESLRRTAGRPWSPEDGTESGGGSGRTHRGTGVQELKLREGMGQARFSEKTT